jgi:predicted kinase
MNPTLHLLIGLPGSGKTTLAKILQDLTDAVRVSSDDYRLLLFPKPKFTQKEHDNLYAMIDHNVEHLLQAEHSVIYDANLNRKIHREEKYSIAKKYGATTILWWVQTKQEVSKQRRVEEIEHHVFVPHDETAAEMHDRISELFEEPDAAETYIVVDGHDIKEADIKKKLEELNTI